MIKIRDFLLQWKFLEILITQVSCDQNWNQIQKSSSFYFQTFLPFAFFSFPFFLEYQSILNFLLLLVSRIIPPTETEKFAENFSIKNKPLFWGTIKIIPLLSASTFIFPANLTSFLLTSWCFLHIGHNVLSLIILSGGIFLTGNPVSSMTFSVPSIFIVKVKSFLWSVTCFISVNKFIDLSVSLSSVSPGSVISKISFCFWYSNLQVFAKCPFLQLWHTDCRAGHLWLKFRFGASQYPQSRSFGFFFGFVPYFPVFVILCISSFLIFFRCDISACGILIFVPSVACIFL